MIINYYIFLPSYPPPPFFILCIYIVQILTPAAIPMAYENTNWKMFLYLYIHDEYSLPFIIWCVCTVPYNLQYMCIIYLKYSNLGNTELSVLSFLNTYYRFTFTPMIFRSVHPPGMRAHCQRRRVWWLLLPLPRVPLRRLRQDQEGTSSS